MGIKGKQFKTERSDFSSSLDLTGKVLGFIVNFPVCWVRQQTQVKGSEHYLLGWGKNSGGEIR